MEIQFFILFVVFLFYVTLDTHKSVTILSLFFPSYVHKKLEEIKKIVINKNIFGAQFEVNGKKNTFIKNIVNEKVLIIISEQKFTIYF